MLIRGKKKQFMEDIDLHDVNYSKSLYQLKNRYGLRKKSTFVNLKSKKSKNFSSVNLSPFFKMYPLIYLGKSQML